MVSKLWLNLILWGLGDRLEKRNDYKTDILMVLNLMSWWALFVFSGPTLYGLLFWFFAIIIIPSSWIGTQIVVGYLLVRGARKQTETKSLEPPRGGGVVRSPPGPTTESEEP